MTDRTVAVGLQAKVAGFVNGFKTAEKAVVNFADRTTKLTAKQRSGLNDVALGAGLLGAAMVGAGFVAVRAFAGFDSAMSKVQAATHESAGNMSLLRDASLEAGARTKFSATEAAGAVEELAKAGVSTNDILRGGLNGALDLAAAGELDVADAGEIAATAMTQFKLSGKDVPHIADLLAAAAGKAQGSVGDMSMALKQSGLVAAQMGLSVEETTGTLAAFASAGLIGSDAGTSFRTMLLRLANPSSEASDLMQELGLHAYDAQGNFVGMTNFAGQLQTKLGGLTQSQRDAALATIFGSDAIRGANVLMSQGEKGIRKWISAVDDQGYAADTAAIKMNNLSGDIEKFMGALETTLVGVGEGANGPLRSLVQQATKGVEEFGKLPGAIQSGLLLLVGGGGLALLGVAGMAKLVVGISEARTALSDLGWTAQKTGRLLKIGLAAGVWLAATAGISQLSDEIHGLDASTDELEAGFKKWNRSGKIGGDLAKIVGDDFGRLAEQAGLVFNPGAKRRLDDFMVSVFTLGAADSEIDNANQAFSKLDQTLSSMDPEAAAKSFRGLQKELRDAGYSQKQINELLPIYTEQVKSAKDETENLSGAQGGSVIASEEQGDAFTVVESALEDMSARAKEVNDALEILNGTMGNVDAEAAFEGAFDKATERLEAYRKEAKEGDEKTRGMKNALDITTEAGRENFGVLKDLWEQTGAYSEQIFRTTGNQNKANAVLATGRDRLVDVAAQFFGSRKKAEEYVTTVLGIPKNVSTKFGTPGLDAANAKAREQARLARDLDGRVVTIRYQNVVSGDPAARYARGRGFDLPAAGGYVSDYHPIVGMAGGGYAGKIRGPGGPRDDMAGLFALSNGEFISTAASTQMNAAALEAGNRGARLWAEGMVRGSTSPSSSTSSSSAPSGGKFEGNLYLDSGELLGLVRGEIRHNNRETRRRVGTGTGGIR